MAYVDFTLLELKEQFGLTDTVGSLFAELPPVEPGEILTAQLNRALKLPLRNEKAKSELIVSPILLELIDRNGGPAQQRFFYVLLRRKLTRRPIPRLNRRMRLFHQ